jgi:hypothetical protein
VLPFIRGCPWDFGYLGQRGGCCVATCYCCPYGPCGCRGDPPEFAPSLLGPHGPFQLTRLALLQRCRRSEVRTWCVTTTATPIATPIATTTTPILGVNDGNVSCNIVWRTLGCRCLVVYTSPPRSHGICVEMNRTLGCRCLVVCTSPPRSLGKSVENKS